MAPTFVFVPGAWHPASCAFLLIEELESAGFPAQAAQLASVGSTKHLKDDISHLRDQVLLPLLNKGEDVIFILHSYAGCPGASAVQGLGRGSRKSGGAVIGLVYLSAFIPVEHKSMIESTGRGRPPFITPDEENGTTSIADPIPLFYGDVPKDLAEEAARSLQGHSIAVHFDPAGPAGFADADFNGRRAFLITANDPCFPAAWQEQEVDRSGVKWDTLYLPTSHSPFLSRPKELADHLVAFANKWT